MHPLFLRAVTWAYHGEYWDIATFFARHSAEGFHNNEVDQTSAMMDAAKNHGKVMVHITCLRLTS
jgi:hypothetical protein